MGIEYLKIPVRLLDRDQVKKGGLDLSKKVLWVRVQLRFFLKPAHQIGGTYDGTDHFGPPTLDQNPTKIFK